MFDSVLKKWHEFGSIASSSVLLTTNRILNKRIEHLNAQSRHLIGRVAEAESKAATFDGLVATLNRSVKELQEENEKLRQSPEVISGQKVLDQEVQIEDLRKTIRELEGKCEDLSKRRRASKADHVLAENIRHHLNVCGASRVQLAAQGLPMVYWVGDTKVPFDALLGWYMDRLSEGMSGSPFGVVATHEPTVVVEEKG